MKHAFRSYFAGHLIPDVERRHVRVVSERYSLCKSTIGDLVSF